VITTKALGPLLGTPTSDQGRITTKALGQLAVCEADILTVFG